jgi:hypothetical protein
MTGDTAAGPARAPASLTRRMAIPVRDGRSRARGRDARHAHDLLCCSARGRPGLAGTGCPVGALCVLRDRAGYDALVVSAGIVAVPTAEVRSENLTARYSSVRADVEFGTRTDQE